MMLRRLSSVFVALLLSVFLLAFGTGGYGTLPDVKRWLFLLICGGYVAAVILIRAGLAISGAQPIKNIWEQIRGIPLAAKLLFGFLFFTILSALFSNYPGTFVGPFRQEGVLSIAIYVLSCFFVSKYLRPEKWMLYLLGAGTALVSLLSFVQLTGANPFTLYPPGYNYYGAGIYYSGEYLGTIGNAGLHAAFISLAAGIFAMSLIKFECKGKWLLALPFFLAVLLIFAMGINAAVFALVVGFVVMLPVAVRNRKTLVNTLTVAAIVTAAFLLSRMLVFYDGGIMLGWDFGGTEASMIYEAAEVLRGNWDDTFGTRRIYIWRSVLEGLSRETLLLGTGPDTLGFWPIEPFSRYLEHLGLTIVSGIDAAHNEYLQILATNGLLAFLSYLGALLVAAVNWFKAPDNALAAVAGAGVLFYAIQAFFGISMFLVAPFFWACLGMLLYAQTRGESAKKKDRTATQ